MQVQGPQHFSVPHAQMGTGGEGVQIEHLIQLTLGQVIRQGLGQVFWQDIKVLLILQEQGFQLC